MSNNYRLLSAAGSVNATNVTTTGTRLRAISGYNASAAARYLKLYDKATAPTVGTDTPKITEMLPPVTRFWLDFGGGTGSGGGRDGFDFAAGMGFALTTAAADADTGALTAGDITCLNIYYY